MATTTAADTLIRAEPLKQIVIEIFTRLGTQSATAAMVADHLVEANLQGHDSHGVGMIPAYVLNIKADLLQPNAGMKILRDNGAVIMIDGQHGFGQRVGREATEFAIARAQEIGLVCLVSCPVNSLKFSAPHLPCSKAQSCRTGLDLFKGCNAAARQVRRALRERAETPITALRPHM